MRRLLLLIFVGLLLLQSGCIREHTSGDTLILRMKWWTLLWGFAVPITVGGLIFAKHPSTWVNGKWRPWWTFHGWDAREMGYALAFLSVVPLMGVAFLFDRLEIAPDHLRESSLSPFRGTRRIAFSDIARIELRPPEADDGIWRGLKPRKEKKSPTMRIFLKNGREEDFEGQLVRHAQSTILDRARKAGVAVANAPPNQEHVRPDGGLPRPGRQPDAKPAHNPPDFDPFKTRSRGSNEFRRNDDKLVLHMMDFSSLRNLILFDGGDTNASHPGRVRAQRWRVAGSYPAWPIALAAFWLLSLAAVFDGFHWSAFALLGLATYGNYAWWGSIGPWFRQGDACPGVVVSEKPLLVATYTDLSACDTSYPAVKIKREPAKRFAGDSGKYGKRVVSIARYDGNSGTALYWPNVSPRAVQCATEDAGEIQRLLREIPPAQWAALQAGVKKLPRPFKPGLYRLTDD